jgi:hydroxymethylglutaryl-CoA reductase
MKMHLQNILNQLGATDEEKSAITTYFDKRTVSHSAVVTQFNALRKPTIHWVDFLNYDEVRAKLITLKPEDRPVFGKMNSQQMIEHLSAVTQIANGNWPLDVFVSEDKSARRKVFLDTENELQIGFKASFLSEEPKELLFNSIDESIVDLIHQLEKFVSVFAEDKNRTMVHPFFGELDVEYWKKFQVKHFTHHFKQFGLV